MERVIYAVGLGPGDYEMITLKAKKVLEESDIIFLSGGKVFNGYDEVKKLLDNINCGSKLKFYEYPENKNDRQAHIKHFAVETVKYLEKGMKVSYVTMGDMTIYSSFPDIYKELAKHNVVLKAVTGISSFLKSFQVFSTKDFRAFEVKVAPLTVSTDEKSPFAFLSRSK